MNKKMEQEIVKTIKTYLIERDINDDFILDQVSSDDEVTKLTLLYNLELEDSPEVLLDINGELSRYLKLGGFIVNKYNITADTVFLEIAEYTYLVEEGLEDLADEIEFEVGTNITNLNVKEVSGKPYVRFNYLNGVSAEEKRHIREKIDEIVSQYDRLDIVTLAEEVDYNDIDDIINKAD